MAGSALAEWELAASRGDPVAMGYLGIAYLYGRGADRDVAEAYCWLASAVGLGNTAVEREFHLAEQELTEIPLACASSH